MASVWGELKRRNVVKVAVAYAIVGWLLIEVAATILPISEAPAWILQVFTLFVVLGFPLALILSWVFDLTPQGMERTETGAQSGGTTGVAGRKLDFAIIGALVLALGFVVYNYVLEDGSDDVPEVAAGVLPNSVAVLSFENLSLDPEDGFFAAGIHEETLNQLVKLSNLSVISRTSVLRYADSDLSIPEIAEELNVETVVEGSVRYADDRVRITAQLIDAATDEHLWSEVYERDFADVFAIQADIAMNIANALEAEFSVTEQEAIEKRPTNSLAAYALYLRALDGSQGRQSQLADLDQAISLDPQFALAYGQKALILSFHIRVGNIDAGEWEPVARAAAETAIALDSAVSPAHAALARLHAAYWQTGEARQAFERVYELSPNDAEVLQPYGLFLRDIGEYAEAIRLLERANELDPSLGRFQLGITHRYAGNSAAAVGIFRDRVASNFASAMNHMHLGLSEVRAGNREEGLTALRTAEELWGDDIAVDRIAQIVVAYAMLERREDVQRLVAEFEARANSGAVGDAQWGMTYLALEDYEQALQRFETAINDPDGESLRLLTQVKANDYGDPVLEQPRWRELRDRIGAL